MNPSDPGDALATVIAAQGDQAFGSEDRDAPGSSFAALRDVLFAEPYYAPVLPGPGKYPLPQYPTTLGSLLRGLFSRGRYQFLRAAERTVDSRADLRWGPDRKGVRRLLHPKGVCLAGTWEVTGPTPYTGYFRQGSTGLVIGRYSVGGESRRGRQRSLALVGKVYPTTDRTRTERVRPASFITQEDFGGSGVDHFNDAELRNAPDTHSWRRGPLVMAMLAVTGLAFSRADTHPTFRQLYEIAELGKPATEETRAPEYLRFLVDPGQRRIDGVGLDFRDEILAQIYDGGNPEPQRPLVFHIEVSDSGVSRGPAFFQRRTITDWKRIGRLVFTEAVASYHGDFVVHFHHPGWRTDRNKPETALRQGGRRVR